MVTNSQSNPGTLEENNDFQVHTIKILLDSGTSASIVRKDVLYKRHRNFKKKKNKWSTMAGNFGTTFIAEIK